jgi:hypothetical protein
MMVESEIKALIRKEVRQALAPILMALVVSNEDSNRSTVQRMPSEPAIGNLRNIQPYGYSSRAPVGTTCLATPVANDPTHLNMLGHFDSNRPTTEDGETLIYDAYTHIIYLSQDKMQFGSKASANPMMLGDIVQSCLSQFLELVANHTHVGNLGYATSVPQTQEDFLNLKASPVDNSDIISAKCFTEK